MTPNKRFSVVAALLFGVPLATYFFAKVRVEDSKNLLEQAGIWVLSHVGLWGVLMMFPPAMLDSALFGGTYFTDELLGYAPRNESGWAFYLFFYFTVALLAGLAARSRPTPATVPAVLQQVPPWTAAVDPSRSLPTSRGAAQVGGARALRRKGGAMLESPLRKLVAFICALVAMWFLPPLGGSPTVGWFNSDGFPRECQGEPLYLLPAARSPKLVERHEPVYSADARASKVKGVALLSLAVLASGDVCGAKIVRGLSPEVDAAILAAVATWRFQPGTYEGAPVAVATRVSVHVDLTEPEPRR